MQSLKFQNSKEGTRNYNFHIDTIQYFVLQVDKREYRTIKMSPASQW